jgi:hypothetical protein
LNKKEKKLEPKVSTSTNIVEFVERHEREFSLMTGPLGSVVILHTLTNVEKSPTHLVCPWRHNA